MMTYTRKTYRLGTTTIAAVLVLSSTEILAQEAPSTDQPLAETPVQAPTPAPDATAPAADPLAPVAEPEAAPATEPTEATAAAVETKAAPKPVAKKSAVKTARATERSTAPAAAPVAPAPKPAVDPPQSSESSPLETMKPAEIASAPKAKPAEKKKLDEAVPLVGGAGAVVLALAGAGMAIRRRKRHDEEEEYEQEIVEEEAVADEPQPEPEQRWDPPVIAPVAAAVPAATQCNDLPEDFDTSKFGRHVQAAYCGPTPENPSLSLRKRLKIAGELDRRERESGQALETAKSGPAVQGTKPVTANPKAPERMAFSFSRTPFEQKWPEKQF